MHNPGVLPAELFDTILECLNHQEPSLPYPPHIRWETVRVANLHACSLVSRAWYRRSTPKLYSRFQHDRYRHSFASLWQFLRTVVEKPELGACVQHLDLRQRYFDNIPDRVVLDAREERSRRHELRALYGIGGRMGYTRQQLFNALRDQVRQPFDVLLMGCLPNVSTLYCSVDACCLAEYDGLGYALEKSGFANKVQNAILFGSPTGFPWKWWSNNADAIFYLPSLRKLVLMDIAIPSMSDLRHRESPRKSSITDLTIVPDDYNGSLSMEVQHWLRDCLEIVKSLVSLTLFIPDQIDETWDFHSNELWEALSTHRHSLQYLDIYRDDAKNIPKKIQQTPPLNRLQEFKKLNTLRIQSRVLLEARGGSIDTPVKLRETVPESLRSLTLYFTAYRNAGFEPELLGLLGDPEAFNLDYLILQDPLDLLENSMSDRRTIDRIRESLLVHFHGAHVLFKLMSIHLLPRGGRNLLRNPETCDPERYVYESHLAEKKRRLEAPT